MNEQASEHMKRTSSPISSGSPNRFIGTSSRKRCMRSGGVCAALWNGVRIGPLYEDRVTGFIPPFERDDRVYQGTAGEGVAVDADGTVFAAEGPNSLTQAGGAFTKYSAK